MLPEPATPTTANFGEAPTPEVRGTILLRGWMNRPCRADLGTSAAPREEGDLLVVQAVRGSRSQSIGRGRVSVSRATQRWGGLCGLLDANFEEPPYARSSGDGAPRTY